MADYFDIVVVGGGIHGAGVAQAAAAAGYSVMLLEQTGLASGTSSRSSKLIHGGLRYLESMQFGLVFECLRERRLLLKLAPDLVRLSAIHIPIYKETTRRPWQIHTGLALYAGLNLAGRGSAFSRLPRSAWSGLNGLSTQGLQTVFQYFDAQTDDAALTRAVMASAISLGAEMSVPAELVNAHVGEQRASVKYLCGGNEHWLECGMLVNAAGPWVNQLMQRIEPTIEPVVVDLVQGTHLVLDTEATAGGFYLESPTDRRAVFVLPWKGHTLLGTTETVFYGDPSLVKPFPEEIGYLQEVYRHYFSHSPAVLDSFAGLRVLPADEGSAFHRARDTRLYQVGRSVSIYGGKLTAYRATAERLLIQIKPLLPKVKVRASTRDLPLVPQ